MTAALGLFLQIDSYISPKQLRNFLWRLASVIIEIKLRKPKIGLILIVFPGMTLTIPEHLVEIGQNMKAP